MDRSRQTQAVIQVLAIMTILIAGLVIAANVAHSNVINKRSYSFDADPVTGQVLRLPATDILGRSVPSSERKIVVACGTCSSCSLHAIDPRKLNLKGNEIAIFLYRTHVGSLKDNFSKAIPNVYVIADSDGVYSQQLNDQWTPRAALLVHGKVAEIGKDPYSLPSFVRIESR